MGFDLLRRGGVLGFEGLVLEAAAQPWGPKQGCSLHPAFAEGNWGLEEHVSLQVAVTQLLGPLQLWLPTQVLTIAGCLPAPR